MKNLTAPYTSGLALGLAWLQIPSVDRPVTVTPVSGVPAMHQPSRSALHGPSFLILPKAAQGRKCCIVLKMRKLRPER